MRLLRLRARRNEGKMKREKAFKTTRVEHPKYQLAFLARESKEKRLRAHNFTSLFLSLSRVDLSLKSSSLGWWSFRVRLFVSVFLSVCRLKENEREGDIFENSLSDLACDCTTLLILLNAQREECTNNNEQTKKESASEKSGEREDGFEGRERRTFGVVFEDS